MGPPAQQGPDGAEPEAPETEGSTSSCRDWPGRRLPRKAGARHGRPVTGSGPSGGCPKRDISGPAARGGAGAEPTGWAQATGPTRGASPGVGSLVASVLWYPMPVGRSHTGPLRLLAWEHHGRPHGQQPEALALLPGLPLVHPRLLQSLRPSQLGSPGHRPSPRLCLSPSACCRRVGLGPGVTTSARSRCRSLLGRGAAAPHGDSLTGTG